MPFKISRHDYAHMFGPTKGDRLRLADTELIIEIESDATVYGDEIKFGGGKVIRDGMGQSQRTNAQGVVDTVITNAVIIDHDKVIKADIGIKAGRIHAIGKAGNPDTQPGVEIVVGPGTDVIAGEGKIVTAGGGRLPHPHDLSATGGRSGSKRDHNLCWRRHWAVYRKQRHDVHAGTLPY